MHECIYANKFAVANGAAFFWRLGEIRELATEIAENFLPGISVPVGNWMAPIAPMVC